MAIDKSNPFDRDTSFEYGPGGENITIKTDPGVKEGVTPAVLKGPTGKLGDIQTFDGASET